MSRFRTLAMERIFISKGIARERRERREEKREREGREKKEGRRKRGGREKRGERRERRAVGTKDMI